MKYSLMLVALLSLSACASKEAPQAPQAAQTRAAQAAAPMMAQAPVQPSTINVVCPTGSCSKALEGEPADELKENSDLRIGVVGQGVAPMNTDSPAQAYALAKRAAVADAYRLIAEKVKGVRIEGDDLIKNMMVKRSTVRTTVSAMIRNANVVETTFKDGLCEVEMEITLSHADFVQ